jgi:hypothetical protein
MVANTGRKNCFEHEKKKRFRTREEKIVSNTRRKNGFEHGKKKWFRTRDEKIGFEHVKKKWFRIWEEKIVSNTGRKMISNTGRKIGFRTREEKKLRRTVSSTVRAYLHDVFDKELLPVLLSCACHQVVVQLNKKHRFTKKDAILWQQGAPYHNIQDCRSGSIWIRSVELLNPGPGVQIVGTLI